MNNKKLKFQKGNAKLNKSIFTFSLPAGYSCPFALDCLSKADKNTGKIKDGKNTIFRCFAATSEAIFPSVRQSRWNNFDTLRKEKNQVKLILESLPKKAEIVRIHVSGDFYNQQYFDTWLKVANLRPDVIFYAYTKSLQFWVNRLGQIPTNLKLNASKGGKNDFLISEYKLKYAEVVFSENEAKIKGLDIDHNDTHAYLSDKPFALLIHSTQPKGSKAADAIKDLKKNKVNFSYKRKK